MASGRRHGRNRAGDTTAAGVSAHTEALGGLTRVAILGIWLLLFSYTGFAINQANRAQAPAGDAASAQILAARVDGEVRAVRAGLAAAGQIAARDPAAPLDAAEAALKTIGRTAEAVAVLGPDGVLAVAGAPGRSEWIEAAKAARSTGDPYWIGRSGEGTYAVLRNSGRGPDVAARLNLAALVAGSPQGQQLAVVGPDGQILAAAGLGAAPERGGPAKGGRQTRAEPG